VVHVDSQGVAVRQVPLQWVGQILIAEVRASNLTGRPVTLSQMTAFSTPCKSNIVPVRPRSGEFINVPFAVSRVNFISMPASAIINRLEKNVTQE
jgi:hypothetical protein